MHRSNIGEFEELVMLVVAILHEGAYGVAVMEEIEQQTGRKINISAVHSALDRLETKGYLKSEIGGATKERGGRRKRFFRITPVGQQALDYLREQRNKLHDQIPRLGLEYAAL